jgi:hypothetical protein
VRHAAAGRGGGAHVHAGHVVAAVIHGVFVYVVCRRLLRSWRSLDNALRWVYAQDWLRTMRMVLGHRCTVLLSLVVTIQGDWLY